MDKYTLNQQQSEIEQSMRANELLVREAAGGVAVTQSLVGTEQERVAGVARNEELVMGLVTELPQTNGVNILAKPDKVRAVEDNVIFLNLNNHELHLSASGPYYVIGNRPVFDGKGREVKKELLLAWNGPDREPSPYDRVPKTPIPAILSVKLSIDELEAAAKAVSAVKDKPLTKSDVDTMLDPKTGELKLDRELTYYDDNGVYGGSRSNVPLMHTNPGGTFGYRRKHLTENVLHKGMHVSWYDLNRSVELDDETMKSFGVYERLQHLAMAFDKAPELVQLLQSAAASSGELQHWQNTSSKHLI